MTNILNPVLTRTYGGVSGNPVPPFDLGEILRYAGVKGKDIPENENLTGKDDLERICEECIREVEGKFSYRVCFSEYEVNKCEEGLDLGFAVTTSEALIKHLEPCDRVVVFGATIGLEIDRLIARYAKISPVKSLFFQAIGAERIEALCDLYNDEIRKEKEAEGRGLVFRFSPGYGDLPLALQREIFSALDCPRKIGLTLNESLLMSPSKSVTAIIGVKRKETGERV